MPSTTCNIGLQVQPRCCPGGSVEPSDCTVMLTNQIGTYYRVDIVDCTGLGSVCGECASLSGSYVVGPIPAGTGGTDAEDDHTCNASVPIGPLCELGFGVFYYENLVLRFRRYGGGTTYETSVYFDPGDGSNELGFAKQTGVPQDPISFVDEVLSIKTNDGQCSLHGCVCTVTAIPPP